MGSEMCIRDRASIVVGAGRGGGTSQVGVVCAFADWHDEVINSDGELYLNFEQDETPVRRALG